MRSPGSSVLRRFGPRGIAMLGAAVCTTICASAVAAQAPVARPRNTQEFGIDAGAQFGLGKRSSVQLTLPAARARIGFFMFGNVSRWSVEPAAFFGYSKVKNVPSVFVYNVELGLLYHFRPPANVYSGPRTVVAYVRPFISENGTHSGGSSNNEFAAGGGLGVKIPWRTDVAFRLEANLGYGFKNKAARAGAFAGLSFFTR